MPTPEFMTVRADQVRGTDDLLVDRQTKKLDESGEPMAQSQEPVEGSKWVYLKLAEPLGRKETIQVAWEEPVPIIRMIPTEAEKRQEAEGNIAAIGLDAQRRAWRLRNQLVTEATSVTEERVSRWTTRTTGRLVVKPAHELARIAERLEAQEWEADTWFRVQSIAMDPDHDQGSLAEALGTVVQGMKNSIIEGFMDDQHDQMRSFIRQYERFTKVVGS